MKVECRIDLTDLIEALEAKGCKVELPGATTAGTSFEISVVGKVSDDEAFCGLPDYMFADLCRDFADPGDVADFVSAAALGDRSTVFALTPRIFVTPRCQSAVEGALYRSAC